MTDDIDALVDWQLSKKDEPPPPRPDGFKKPTKKQKEATRFTHELMREILG